MQKLKRFFLFVLASMLFVSSPIGAVSQNVVISQVQPGPDTAKSNEFVELYNNSDSDVDITNWCMYYSSPDYSDAQAMSLSWGKKACYTVENSNLHTFLPSKSSSLMASKNTSTQLAWVPSDLSYSATFSLSGGHVRIVDNFGVEVDKLGWGTAVSPEGGAPAIASPTAGKVISRKVLSGGQMQDTDKNSDDFELASAKEAYVYGNIYEVQDLCANIDGIQESLPDGYVSDDSGNCKLPPVDICSNLDGIQESLPAGYLADENGDCQADLCLNLGELQLTIPDGLDKDSLGNCLPHDECVNLPEVQAIVPEGYTLTDDNYCIEKFLPLDVTELLPNAIGLDDGNEFIEIFNPNMSVINLSNYQIVVNEKAYDLPSLLINPVAYNAIYNNAVDFTLVNTSGAVRVKSKNGSFVGGLFTFVTAIEGESWANINGDWQYTNQPTPGNANLALVIEAEETEVQLQPCGPNQYRSPDTNRCRNIVVTTSTLADCQTGYERNPETNRCRKIVIEDELTPCQTGYERNLETNRCNKVTVLGASDLVPCQTGYERNPETNRCRKMTTSSSIAPYKPEQSTNKSSSNITSVLLIIAIVLVAVGYGIWEWRVELKSIHKKLGQLLHFRK